MSECGVLEGLNARAYDGCIPLHVSLELTLRCNIRCTHCYNFDRDRPRGGAAGPELSMEEIRGLFGDLRRAGTLFLSLTGGEAMAHPRFWEVADLAAERGFAVTLLSNGTLLSESACDRLSVRELTALLEAAAFVVSNDTSVMHLTGLVGTPVVAFFGPTEPRIYGPRGDADLVFYKSLFCSPCLSNYNLKMSRCVNPVCMRAITVEEVVRGVDARFPAAPRAASL